MITVNATCPDCHFSNKLDISKITVRLCLDLQEYSYYYICANCASRIAGGISFKKYEELRKGAVKIEHWRLPDELYELKVGHPINTDDLLDFMLALEQSNWSAELRNVSVDDLLQPPSD